ncbi:MAG: efflux RND transporter permease subunit [Sandaracinaceae bacterium]|nr:efflux RND transporter permease subunit [Sandaracinaceae bacterium]
MTLGELSIRRGVTTAMIYLCLVGFGLFSLSELPLNRLPEVDLPVIAVVTTYVGASPEDIETLLSEPIERAVASVENIESIQSTSRQGTSIVILSFTWGTDMDAAEVEVRKNLELFASDLLPDEASRPLTFAFDPSLAPVMFLALDGPLDGYQLRRLATDQVQPYLGRLEGVAAAEVMGGLDREIQVRLHPRWLQANGIAPSQVTDALRGSNIVMPSGAVDDGAQRLALQPTSLFRSVEEIQTVIVGQRGGRAIQLREVAEVEDTFEEETHVVTSDGAPAVMLAVRRQSDANTVQVARAIDAALPEIEARLPEGVRLVPLFDESRPILRSIRNLADTGWQSFLLTGLVLLVFLRSWRTSLITMIAIPTSIVVAFVFMRALDVTLNLISMAGLALAIGMLVDNAIVVLEAAFQQIEKGKTSSEAAILAVKEMGMPLVASTLTTVVVFLPILLVEGLAGEIFRDMVLTITVTLLSSLVVAITLVPLMISRMVKGAHETGRFSRVLTKATGFVDRLGPIYERALAWALRHRKSVLAIAALAFAASVGVSPLLGRDFLPKADVSEVRIEVTAAPGTSLDEMRELIAGVEDAIHQTVPESEVLTADFGTAEGFGAIFGGTANKGTLRIRLPEPARRARSQQDIEAALSARFRDVPGIDVRLASFSLGGGGGDVQVKIFADDLDVLRRFGETLRRRLEGVEGVREASFSMLQGAPELSLRYDRERMRVLGVSPAVVANTVAAHYQGVTATSYREQGDEHLVRIRAPREERRDLDSLRYLPISLPSGGTVPLGSLVEIGDRLGPVDIERRDQRRMATVTVAGANVDLGTLTERVEAEVARTGVPEGVYVETGGTAEDLRDAFFKLAMAFLAALALVYMVMASQFESLLEPFVIMFTVPLAIVGVVLALFVTSTSIQVTALVGVILLGGVVVNNGIVLVDVLKRRRLEGADLMEASLEAGRTRLRPILMTALTTILGMVPLAFGLGDGAEIWAPMARAVVGGMIVATFLTLFVIPVVYVILAGWIDRRRARRVLREEQAAAAAAPAEEREAA